MDTQALHCAIALELLRSQKLSYVAIAYHFDRAGRPEDARKYFLAAGRWAYSNGSVVEAISLLTSAFNISEKGANDPLDEGLHRLYLGESLYKCGNYGKSVKELKKGLELAGRKIPTSFVGVGSLVAGVAWSESYGNRGYRTSMLDDTNERMTLLQATSQAYLCLAQIYMLNPIQYSGIDVVSALLKAFQEAELVKDSSLLAQASAWLGTAAVVLGRHRMANHFLSRVRALGTALPNDRSVEANISYLSMMMSGMAGKHDDAAAHGLKAVAAYDAIGDIRRSTESHLVTLTCLTCAGKFGDAERKIDRIVAQAQQCGDMDMQRNVMWNRVAMAMWRGDHELVREANRPRDRSEHT